MRGTQSRWHQVLSDEVWHLYEGGTLELLETDEELTSHTSHTLAPVGQGMPVHTIAARRWQAARPLSDYALAGCTVAPGFEFGDFRLLASDPVLSERLRARWPDAADLI